MILLLGSEGSMGQRYQAILKYLGQPFYCSDAKCPKAYFDKMDMFTGIILATPTDTHIGLIKSLAQYNIPILCEKPVTKNIEELREIKGLGINLTVMMQYKMLDYPNSHGLSYYDYFRHGQDGLSWDCFQIIALARGTVLLREESPVWKCQLNGKVLSIADMDMAYITFVDNWLNEPGQRIDDIIEYHEKVLEWQSKRTSV